jgi:hypothetical protein
MIRTTEHRKYINWHGRDFAFMLLPVFSQSKPKQGRSRIVFDWGKSLPNPNARVAVALLSSTKGQFINRLIYDDQAYTVDNLRKCRSGRIAGYIRHISRVNEWDRALVTKIMDELMS